MIRLLLDADAAMSVRFAMSPATETEFLVRLVARHPNPEMAPEPWVRDAARRLSMLEVGELAEILRGDHAWPGFLAPIPPLSVQGDLFEWQVRQTAATPLEQVEKEIEWAFQDRSIPRGPLESAEKARSLLAEQLSRTYRHVVAPMWRRVEAVLRTDLAVRSHQSSEGGLAAVVNTLHPRLRLADEAIEYSSAFEHEIPINDGLVLVPSVFGRGPAIEDQPAIGPMQIIYPARGSALLYELDEDQDNSALIDLLGATRVEILVVCAEPTTTTDLAARLDLAPGTVSPHLTTMTSVGWLTRTRIGRRVFYELSSLGRVILNRTIDHVTKTA